MSGRLVTIVRTRRGKQLVAVCGAAACVLSVVVSQAQATPSSFLELDGNVVSNGALDWANGSTTNGVEDSTLSQSNGGAAPSTYSRSGSGGVFDGGVFNGNTTPPTNPPRTTAAANDTTIVAAQFKVDPLSVDHVTCNNGGTPKAVTGDPTVYTGTGSETNGDLLSSDTFGYGSVPNKDDLSNVYALAHIDATAPHTPPAGDVGVNEVFFGAERVINTGDSHIDFEFLQNKVTIPDSCAGNFAGDRAEGDFLLSVDFTAGGNFGGIQLYRWDCLLPAKNKPYPTQPIDGTVCNPPAHGQTSGPHYQPTGTDAVQINVNGHPNNDNSIENNIKCGGWVCRNADGSPTAQIGTNELMEGGIDLKQLGFTGCLSTFLPHTRSSQSFTATLKDFEIIPFNTCATPTITTTIRNAAGDDVTNTSQALGTVLHDTATLHGTAGVPTGSVSYTLYTAPDCGGAATDLTPTSNALVNGVPPDSKTFPFDNAGTYYFKASAVFTDDRNQGTPDSGCNAEPVTISPATPAPHSAPVVQIKDTFRVTGLSPHPTGDVTVGVYTAAGCTDASHVANSDVTVAASLLQDGSTHEISFFTATSGATYYFKISYAGDTNNTRFSNCDESATSTVVSLT